MHPRRLRHHRDPTTAQLGCLRRQHQPPLPLVQMRTQHRVPPRHRLPDLHIARHSTNRKRLNPENLRYFVASPKRDVSAVVVAVEDDRRANPGRGGDNPDDFRVIVLPAGVDVPFLARAPLRGVASGSSLSPPP
jgi:hypothetical protein